MSEPKRQLIVTVGTSLFTSASWEEGQEPFKSIPGYPKWVEAKYLKSPGARARMLEWNGINALAGKDVEAAVFSAIQADPTGTAGAFVVPAANGDGLVPGRYSAEMATILRIWEDERPKTGSVPGPGAFLAARYEVIRFLCSLEADDAARVAAEHLQAQIRKLSGEEVIGLETWARLSRSGLREKVKTLAEILGSEAAQGPVPVDLVISGGYKIYAAVATYLLQPGWRLYYLHEDAGSELVTQESLPGRGSEQQFGFSPRGDGLPGRISLTRRIADFGE